MRRMEKIYLFIISTLCCFAVLFSSNIYAAMDTPCTKDIAKYCKDVKSDNRSIIKCLEEHEGELSQECRDYEMRMENPRGERREAARLRMSFQRDCKTDIINFCKDANPKQGGIVKCIYKFEKKASPSCQEWIKMNKKESGKI